MKYGKGWSSSRGRATHLYAMDWDYALCGAPIRVTGPTKRLKALEICDHCQREQRKRRR